jgi:hypothetical protein
MPASFPPVAAEETDPVASAAAAAETARALAAEATKQDAATAASALADGLAGVFGTAPTGQIAAGFDTPRHYTGAKPIIITLIGGVASDPGENGHIYFETSPDNADWTSFQKLSYVACRNRIENTGQIGAGGTIWGVVKPGHWWRYRTYTAAGYNTPDFVMDDGIEWIYPVAT